MEEYYPDELAAIFGEYNILHQVDRDEEKKLSPMEFLGGGGEQVGS